LGLEQRELPFVDEHQIRVAAPRGHVWTELRRYVDSSLGFAESNPLARLLGTEPRTGFELTRAVPDQHVSMTGRHRVSRYLLVFELADLADGQTLVTGRTYAEFPGPLGRIYRALVIGTGAHVVAMKHMLESIRRLSLG
jgi:hypothetical protein